MLARLRKTTQENEGGFTLIELLVVMIIIGILAAIAIPAFLNQKNKAKGTSAKADVTTIGKEISAYFVDNGTPATAITVTGATSGGTWSFNTTPTAVTGALSSGNRATGTVTSETNFCVTVWNTDVDGATVPATNGGNATWRYTQAGIVKGAC